MQVLSKAPQLEANRGCCSYIYGTSLHHQETPSWRHSKSFSINLYVFSLLASDVGCPLDKRLIDPIILMSSVLHRQRYIISKLDWKKKNSWGQPHLHLTLDTAVWLIPLRTREDWSISISLFGYHCSRELSNYDGRDKQIIQSPLPGIHLRGGGGSGLCPLRSVQRRLLGEQAVCLADGFDSCLFGQVTWGYSLNTARMLLSLKPPRIQGVRRHCSLHLHVTC